MDDEPHIPPTGENYIPLNASEAVYGFSSHLRRNFGFDLIVEAAAEDFVRANTLPETRVGWTDHLKYPPAPGGECVTVLNPAEIVYGVFAWLTCRPGTATFGAAHEAATGAELAQAFIKANNLGKVSAGWPKGFVHPTDTDPQEPREEFALSEVESPEDRRMRRSKEIRKSFAKGINRVSAENGSDTPDFILAEFLAGCLEVFDKTLVAREKWYGREVSSTRPAPIA